MFLSLRFKDDIKIIHFIGSVKPWHHLYLCNEDKVVLVRTSDQSQYGLVEYIKRWWQVYTSTLPKDEVSVTAWVLQKCSYLYLILSCSSLVVALTIHSLLSLSCCSLALLFNTCPFLHRTLKLQCLLRKDIDRRGREASPTTMAQTSSTTYKLTLIGS